MMSLRIFVLSILVASLSYSSTSIAWASSHDGITYGDEFTDKIMPDLWSFLDSEKFFSGLSNKIEDCYNNELKNLNSVIGHFDKNKVVSTREYILNDFELKKCYVKDLAYQILREPLTIEDPDRSKSYDDIVPYFERPLYARPRLIFYRTLLFRNGSERLITIDLTLTAVHHWLEAQELKKQRDAEHSN